MSKNAKIFVLVMILLVFCIIMFCLSIHVLNDNVAKSVENELKDIPLPSNTELLDSISIAGKLTGNGNGMQYFGAILIKTQLNIKELNEYYKQYRKNEWSCLIGKYNNEIYIIEHGKYRFKNINNNEFDGCYIVYSWGDINNGFLNLDIRGH